jgi:hypothetical protein
MLLALFACCIICSPAAEAFHSERLQVSQCDGQECCDCSENSEFCEESCEYEQREDDDNELLLDLSLVTFNYLVLFISEQRFEPCLRTDSEHICSHSFAIRHLDTIILRV